MNKHFSTIALCATALLTVSCGTKQAAQSVAKYTISADKAISNKLSNIDQFVDSIWMTALITPPDAEQSEITKAIATESKIFTFDELYTKKINAYNMDGEYLFSVSNIGRGDQEAINITDFSVSGNNIFITDPTQKRTLVFSTDDGRYIKTLSYPFAAREFHPITANRYLFVLTDFNTEGQPEFLTHSVVVTDSTFQPIAFGLKHPAADQCNLFTRSIWNEAQGSSFYSMYDEALYQYDPATDSITQHTYIDFGADKATPEMLSDINKYMTHFENENILQMHSNSPVWVGQYLFAILRKGTQMNFLVCNQDQAYTTPIEQSTYKVTDPFLLLGTMGDDVLISKVEYSDIEQVKPHLRLQPSGQITTVLLFSKLKTK